MFAHAVHHLAVAHLSGQRDTVVGSPVDNRTEALRGAVGYFVNMVALRIDSSGDRTIRDLLRRETLPPRARPAQRQRERPSSPPLSSRRSRHATHGENSAAQGEG